MGRRVRFAAACALTFGAVTSGVLLGITSAGAQVDPIRVDMTGGRVAFLDFDGDGRPDTGDRFTGRSPLVDPASGEPVGGAFSECIAMTRIVVEQSRGTWICTYVLTLADGHIIVQGKDPAGLRGGTPYVLAVTGGTGLYRNARGEADAVDVEERTEITIHLEP
jgi:hypothetical protein